MVRHTEQAYIKGLQQGYALAKAQYTELLRDTVYSEVTKDQVNKAIENNVCRWCDKYNNGKFCEGCNLCKVFECYKSISWINT